LIQKRRRSLNDDIDEGLPEESMIEKTPDKVTHESQGGYDLVDVQNKAFKEFSKIFSHEQDHGSSSLE
jgi:hypothetical protein